MIRWEEIKSNYEIPWGWLYYSAQDKKGYKGYFRDNFL